MAWHFKLFDQLELRVCWHAATSSETVFKKKYNSFTIKRMNVVVMCDEVLRAIAWSLRKRTRKCSLYIFAQLVYGGTKIHSYQVTYYQKEVFELEKRIHPPLPERVTEPEVAIEPEIARENGEPPELQVSQETFCVVSDAQSLTLQEYNCDIMARQMIERKLEEWQDFGVLTDEELAFYYREIGETLLDRTENGEQVVDRSKEMDVADTMAADTVIAEEIHKETRSPALTRTREKISKPELTVTPQKRRSEIQVETPTKRKRLTFGEVVVGPPEPAEETEPTAFASPQKKQTVQPDTNMELESLNIPVQPKTGKKKQKIIIDKTTLKEISVYKWIENPNIHCKKFKLPQVRHKTSVAKLLAQPATAIFTRWGRDLQRLFGERATPCAFPIRDEAEDIAPSMVMQSEQAVRADEVAEMPSIVEKSSVLGKTLAGITADSSTGLNVSNIPSIAHPTDLNVIPETRETVALPEPPSDIIALVETISIAGDEQTINAKKDDTESTLEDIDALLKRQSPAKTHVSLLSSSSSERYLTSRDISAMLQVLWQERPSVALNDLISEDTYSTKDLAVTFEILLNLHAQKKVVLFQKFFYDTLYIKDPKFASQ